MRLLLFIFTLLSVSACASAPKSFDQKFVEQYQSRVDLEKSLLEENGEIKEGNIEKILTTKVKLPDSLSIAIVRLPEAEFNSVHTITKESASTFLDRKNWGSRVHAVIPLPQMLMAKEPNLKNLRQAAALLQADMLVIVRPASRKDWRMNFLSPDQAKAISSLEVLLMDVRTSVIPFTTLISEEAEVDESMSDYSKHELMLRATQQSELKASLQIPIQIKSYLEKVL